jgi:hypothetical protein
VSQIIAGGMHDESRALFARGECVQRALAQSRACVINDDVFLARYSGVKLRVARAHDHGVGKLSECSG